MPRKKPTAHPEGSQKGLPSQPPRGLGRHGKHFWKTYAPLANQMGAAEADGAAFLACAEHYELAMIAWDKIRADGLFRLDENGVTRRHPAAQVHRDSWAAVVKTLGLFGLTPASRGFASAGEGLDEFELYLLRRQGATSGGGDEW